MICYNYSVCKKRAVHGRGIKIYRPAADGCNESERNERTIRLFKGLRKGPVFDTGRARFSLTAALCAAVMAFCGYFLSPQAHAYGQEDIKGASATGAAISGYGSAIAVDAQDMGADSSGEKDSTAAIQKALDYAADNASDTVQVKVIIPEGTYLVSSPLYIYSNTWIYMSGATLKNTADRGCIFRNANESGLGGYEGNHNIIIEGGCLDGGTYAAAAFCSLRIAHARNVWIKDVDLVNNCNCHHAEFGGVQNLTIEGCQFHEYYGDKLKEAIQFDTMNNEVVFGDFPPFDDAVCDNVVVRNNSFYNLMRGLGSHSATVGLYYTNFYIGHNTFENIYDVAVIMENYRKCTIEDNVFSNVGSGIDFKSITPFEYSGYNPPVYGYDGIYDRINDFSDTVIRRNTFSTLRSPYRSRSFAVSLFGRYASNNYFPEHDYKVGGVEVSENTMTVTGAAVIVKDGADIGISKNIISSAEDRDDNDIIEVSYSERINVSGNTVTGSGKSGIVMNGCTDCSAKDNACTACEGSGIYASEDSSGIKLSGNVIDGTGSHGIALYSGAQADIAGNTVTNAGENGIYISNSAGTVSGNNVSGCTGSGIYLSNSGEINVRDNTVKGCTGCGIYSASGAAAILGGNKTDGNLAGRYGTEEGEILTAGPEVLSADGVYSDHAQLSWKNVGDAEYYLVERRARSAQEDFAPVAEVALTSYADTDLEPRTVYEYRVTGVVSIGDTKVPGRSSEVLSLRTKTDMNGCTSDLEGQYRYCGRSAEPAFSVYCGEEELIAGVDYRASYKNNTSVGRASVVVTGIGQYCGFKEFFFDLTLTSGSYAQSSQDALYKGGQERYVVAAVAADSPEGRPVNSRHSSVSPLIDSINETKRSSGVEVYVKRVSGKGISIWLG